MRISPALRAFLADSQNSQFAAVIAQAGIENPVVFSSHGDLNPRFRRFSILRQSLARPWAAPAIPDEQFGKARFAARGSGLPFTTIPLLLPALLLTFTTITHGQTFTFKDLLFVPYGINNSGTIVGYDPLTGSGVIYSYTTGTSTTLNYPNSTTTSLLAINSSGDILGAFGTTSPLAAGPNYFLYRQGSFFRISSYGAFPPYPGYDCSNDASAIPHVCTDLAITGLSGLNDKGEVVGYSTTSQTTGTVVSSTTIGFFGPPSLGAANSTAPLNSTGTYTQVSCPNSMATSPFGVNNSDAVTGNCGYGPPVSYPLFIFSGSYSTFLYPGSVATTGRGINNAGQVVGGYQPSGATISVGLVYYNGSAISVKHPNSTTTSFTGINDNGLAVGVSDAPSAFGFVTSIGAPALTIITTSLPNATSGQPYWATLTATGGSGSGQTWSIASGALPTGFALSPAGVISSTGTPAASAGSYSLTVKVIDSAGNTATQQFSLVVVSVPISFSLVDPVPKLLNGSAITTDISQLSDPTKGRPVQGIATDGIAQVLIRIAATSVGQQFTLSMASNQCAGVTSAGCIDQYGLLFDPTNPPGPDVLFGDFLPQTPVAVTAVQTASGPIAVAAYRAPVDFVRQDSNNASDQGAAQRSVSININGVTASPNIVLVRPPVVLIHGTFSDATVFDNFSPLQPASIAPNETFAIFTLAYNQIVDCHYSAFPCVGDTFPSYPATRVVVPIRRNVIGLAFNTPLLLHDLVTAISKFSAASTPPVTIPVAAIQADIVAHSLGGLMARGLSHVGTDFTYGQIESFYDDATYGKGYIHKLITLGTPHLGTNLALRSVNGDKVPGDPTVGALFPGIGGNDCTRDSSALFGGYSLNSITFYTLSSPPTGSLFPGAAFDQLGDPTQGILSPTLITLNQPTHSGIPTALIAAQFGAANNSSNIGIWGAIAQASCGSRTVFYSGTPGETVLPGDQRPCQFCTFVSGDFLADNYSFPNWQNIFNGAASDVVVPFNSATFGLPIPVSSKFPEVVHGPGTVNLGPPNDPHFGFNGPQLLDPASGVPQAVVNLLNTPVTNTSQFFILP